MTLLQPVIKNNKKVAVIQSNYIPWLGYFAVMNSVDLFIVYECVQYTKNDWRNRNKIQTKNGCVNWLSIPIRHHSVSQQFMETKVFGNDWAKSHFSTLRHNFSRSKCWHQWGGDIKLLYEKAEELNYLYEINRIFLSWIKSTLDIRSQIVFLDFYNKLGRGLRTLMQNFDAKLYLSGPAAKGYLDPLQFKNADIDIEYIDYSKILRSMFINTNPVKTTSVMQWILEGYHELKHN